VPVQSANQAEIDFYMKPDAPEFKTAQGPHGPVTVRNSDYNIVTHAQRNDDRNAHLGSTSKMQKQVLIRHNRLALVDTRSWDQAKYGQICGHYRKSSEHPLMPGKTANANLIPPALPGPNDMIWATPGSYPIGHPPEGSTGGLYSNPAYFAGNQAKNAPSLRYYDPYKPIPAPNKAAVSSIRQVLDTMRKEKGAAQLINQFETYYEAWKKTWFAGQAGESPK
jgi:hypothetical protein